MGKAIFKIISPIAFLCILSFLTAFIYNQLNLVNLPAENLRMGQTVITNDDVSYINPPRNFLNEGEWKENNLGTVGYFIRPPGYGLLYMCFLKISNARLALLLLKFFQLVLFSFSVYWFYFITLSIVKNEKLSLIGSAVYGLSPFMTGFLFYTLTEGITPQLMLLFVFLLTKAYDATTEKEKNKLYLFASLVFAYLILVRPVLGLFGLLLSVFLWKEYLKRTLKNALPKLFIFCAIAIGFISTWEIRNYKIAGEYVGLHPIYFDDGNSIYRKPFKEYWNFAGNWAEKPDVGFGYMVPFWEAAIKGDTSKLQVDEVLYRLPQKVVEHFGRAKLSEVLRDYQKAILIQKPFYEKQLPMPRGSYAEEEHIVKEFRELSADYRSSFWLESHVLSPLKVFGAMAFHSNLSMYIFQKTYRGNFLVEAMRYLFYGIHMLCFFAVFLNFFIARRHFLVQSIVSTIPFIYIFYLCYFQRGIEERYMLPVLPLLMIGLMYSLKRIFRSSFSPRDIPRSESHS